MSVVANESSGQRLISTSDQAPQLIKPHTSHDDSINFANFNQDFSCVSVGYQSGYKLFNCDPFGRCFTKLDGSIGIVEMLFSSSLLAIVGMGEQHALSPRRLKIINTKRQTTICELTFPGAILAVKMNRERFIVLLETTIYVYDINNMRLLHTIEIPPNPNGLIALSPKVESNYLAYPSPQKITTSLNNDSTLYSSNNNNNSTNIRNGDVIIFNAKTLQPLSVIEAHKTGLAAIALSSDGLLLATASDKGTIIRVFSVETGIKLFQFRRGTYPTKIYSLAFSPDNRFVVASSATETVHIFRLGEDELTNTIRPPNVTVNPSRTMNMLVPPSASGSAPSSTGTSPTNLKKSYSDNGAPGATANASDEEEVEDQQTIDVLKPPHKLNRKLSQSSSLGSLNSSESNPLDAKMEPLVDSTRRSVARMLRRTSQSLGRKAAEKMGVYLPPKFSSILEPNRHFASLKVPVSKDTRTVVGIGNPISDEILNTVFHDNASGNIAINSTADDSSSEVATHKLISVMVITSEGVFYNFGLDPERGGDCVLLGQYSLLNENIQ